MKTEDVIQTLLHDHNESAIADAIDEQMAEYVDDDWEDTHDSEYEWYIDHCNGEATDDILGMVIRKYEKDNKLQLSVDDCSTVFEALRDTWGL